MSASTSKYSRREFISANSEQNFILLYQNNEKLDAICLFIHLYGARDSTQGPTYVKQMLYNPYMP